MGDSGDYTVSHSSQVFVLDSAGRLRAEFFGASTEAMSAVTLALLEEAQEESSSQKSVEKRVDTSIAQE